MADTATETTSLIAVMLPSTRYSAWMARYHVRAVLKQYGLESYTDDATAIASELVTNAVLHTDSAAVGLELAHLWSPGTLAIVVTDTSPTPPVKREVSDTAECGRGLCLVDALSARWGWQPKEAGKAVYAILAGQA